MNKLHITHSPQDAGTVHCVSVQVGHGLNPNLSYTGKTGFFRTFSVKEREINPLPPNIWGKFYQSYGRAYT